MDPLWLLKGGIDAPGWREIEQDSKANKIDLVIFDRDSFALIRAPEAPTKYEGFKQGELKDGMYVSEQGYPVYIVNGEEVSSPKELITALGREAETLLQKFDDPDVVLQRLGRVF